MLQQNPSTLRTKVSLDVEMPYLLSLPDGYEAERDERWPVLVFLHGAGERGNDLELVKRHGPPKEIAAGRKLPFIVVSPQCAAYEWWSNPVQVATLSRLLDEVVAKHRVDRDRIYLTGLSMGGFGTWAWAAAEPERFAAIAPICGIGDPSSASRLTMPIWARHGDADQAVSYAEGVKVVNAVKAAGGNIRFDTIEGGGHDVWTEMYADDAFYAWLLKQRRS